MSFSLSMAASSLVIPAFPFSMMTPAVAVAMVLLRWQELSMKSFRQLFFSRFTHTEYSPGETECLSGHGVVEVNLDFFLLDFNDACVAYLTLGVEHGHETPFHEQVFPQDSVHYEGILGDVEAVRWIVFPVGILRSYAE